MEEILKKISSYNIFNFLLPGTIFAFAAEVLTDFSVVQDDLLIALFLYYFFGLIISRVGSIVVESGLKKVGFLEFAEYPDFVHASQKDATLVTLSEVNNTLRTMCSLMLFIPGVVFYEKLIRTWPGLTELAQYIMFALLLLLFVLSYRKQTKYITKRIEANK